MTVPKVIASGETITVPAGRVAVLPNVKVDGVLDIQGDVFIPAGSSISQTVSNAYNYTLGGITLSTWSSLSVIEGAGGTFFGSNGISALTGSNATYSGTWKYKVDGSAGLQLVNQGSHQFRVGAAGLAGGDITWDTVANIDSTGMNVKAGSAAVPGYGFLGDTDTGIWNPAANTLAVSVGGTEKMRVASTGVSLDATPTASDNSLKVATTAYVDRKMTLATAQNSTSGTSIDFTGIPSWAKRITVMMKDVSLSGTSPLLVQIGNTTIQNNGYNSSSGGAVNATAPAVIGSTAGFMIYNDVASDAFTAIMKITNISSNSYVSEYTRGGTTGRTVFGCGAGSVTLTGVLDRVRITTVNGTDTFDAGQINIMYEG